MREIRFRGKHEDTNEWVYGYFVKDENDNCLIESGLGLGYEGYDYVFVISETVGQFTGLKDKNGVDIYELSEIDDMVVIFKNCKYVLCEISNGDIIEVENLFDYMGANDGKITREYTEI